MAFKKNSFAKKFMRKKRLISFLKENQNEINEIQRRMISLYNKCGKQYDDSGLQTALALALIGVFLKIVEKSGIPKQEISMGLNKLSKKLK